MTITRVLSRTLLGLSLAAATSTAARADDQPNRRTATPPTSQGQAGAVNATQPPEAGRQPTTRDNDDRNNSDRDKNNRDNNADNGQADATTRGMGADRSTRYTGRYQGCRSTKLIGSKVVNPEGKDLGKIEDIAVDPDSGRVAYAVLSFGGFLGIGDKYFAIPFESLKFDPQNDEKVSLAVEKSQLENAKGFDKNDWPDMANEQWARHTHESYGTEPYWESLTGNQQQHPTRVMRVSELEGEDVKNFQDENLGDIAEIVIDANRGQIAYAVIGSGGFLDIGEDLIAVPWQKLDVQDDDTIRLGVDKDALTAGPRINKKQWPGAHDDAYLVQVYRYYNVAPYWTEAVGTSRISDATRTR
ncbi:MAG TPA: PRC-barrel domain-containing protein, partial [Phycisphaerae bacterium]|nr:PRC-barrel domain-containing protein [Phycisphaerae bacterium]